MVQFDGECGTRVYQMRVVKSLLKIHNNVWKFRTYETWPWVIHGDESIIEIKNSIELQRTVLMPLINWGQCSPARKRLILPEIFWAEAVVGLLWREYSQEMQDLNSGVIIQSWQYRSGVINTRLKFIRTNKRDHQK